MRKLIVVGVLLACFGCMGFLFWQQELQYVLPTPVPSNYSSIATNQQISLPPAFPAGQAIYLHFFNPDCPCSRFNLKHFKSLTNEFSSKVKIYAVIPAYADVQQAGKMIDDDRISILQDVDDRLASACGVYSTPQAVVLDATHKLFFRGNYNKTRYCTLKESNYAEMALEALVRGEAPPVFNAFATQSYGCQLPSDQDLTF